MRNADRTRSNWLIDWVGETTNAVFSRPALAVLDKLGIDETVFDKQLRIEQIAVHLLRDTEMPGQLGRASPKEESVRR